MDGNITIFHGSSKIIENPVWGEGNIHNDYGQAFYCTESIEMAKEWAVSEEKDGFANEYRLDVSALTMLDLGNGDYHILNWLAILLENRVFRTNSDIGESGKQYILDNFLPEHKNYDLIKGYRADDSYFSFANLFINNGLSLEKLSRAMMLGNLGNQIAIRSQKGFEKIVFCKAHGAYKYESWPGKCKRDLTARKTFQDMKGLDDGVYLTDIIRGRWRNEDERLQRIVSG